MKLVPYQGVLVKEYVGEILKRLDKFQVVPSSMKVFTTNLNGPLSQMVSRPSGRARDEPAATPLAPASQIQDMSYSAHHFEVAMNILFTFHHVKEDGQGSLT